MGNVADYVGGWQQQQQQRSYAAGMCGSAGIALLRETRRSWTAKDKPHVCRHPGCDKSYFYLHDLRRHEKQKQHSVAGGDTDNKDDDHDEADGRCQQEMSPEGVSELMAQSTHTVQEHVTNAHVQQLSLT